MRRGSATAGSSDSGSSDAKGPIAAAIEAVEMLRAAGQPVAGTLELELVADEETMGHFGAGFLVEEGLIHPNVAIVGEPTSLRVVLAQRGASWLRIKTRGKAAHGSAPERGRSAILHMAEIVLHLEETLPDITHPVVGGPSINVGTNPRRREGQHRACRMRDPGRSTDHPRRIPRQRPGLHLGGHRLGQGAFPRDRCDGGGRFLR